MSDLLSTSLVIALVVVSVVLLSYAVRPLLPPARPPMTDAELDEETLRGLGLAGQSGRPRPEAPRPPADVIPFPRGPRDPILDEDERLYRDPIIAARLRQVLEPNRRRISRLASASPAPPGGERGDRRSTPPPIRPWRAGEHERRRVRHTDGEPSAAGMRDGAPVGHRQEPTQMSPSEMVPVPGAMPVTTTGQRGSLRGRDGESVPVDEPRSNVVPFAPRQAVRDASQVDPPVDEPVVGALTATVRELLFCANVGEYLHGFALYSDRYLFRFMDETGFTVDEFRAAFEDAAPREAGDWTRLSHLGEVRRLADGRVSALVTYVDGDLPGGSERYTFEFSAARGLWLIDDIAQI